MIVVSNSYHEGCSVFTSLSGPKLCPPVSLGHIFVDTDVLVFLSTVGKPSNGANDANPALVLICTTFILQLNGIIL